MDKKEELKEARKARDFRKIVQIQKELGVKEYVKIMHEIRKEKKD